MEKMLNTFLFKGVNTMKVLWVAGFFNNGQAKKYDLTNTEQATSASPGSPARFGSLLSVCGDNPMLP